MTPTPIKIQADSWPFTLCEGNSVTCRRVYQNGIIRISNRSKESASLSLSWMSDLDSGRTVQQMSFQLVPGGRLELMADEFGCNICLDRIVVDHVSGGEIQISQPAPLVTLN